MFDIKTALNELISGEIERSLRQKGFTLKRKTEFTRIYGEFKQYVYIIFNKIKGQEAGNIQVNVAFRHDELEKRTSELNGEEHRKDWPSASICIGYLTEEREYIQWLLNESSDIKELGNIILEYIDKYAFSFWEKYSTIQALINGYKNQDIELTITGNSYVWSMAAAYWLKGEAENARKTLECWTQGRPSEEDINRAIEKLMK